jgi:hypothetical protein
MVCYSNASHMLSSIAANEQLLDISQSLDRARLCFCGFACSHDHLLRCAYGCAGFDQKSAVGRRAS